MKVLFTQEVRKKICEEVLKMQQSTSLKVSDITKRVGEKYNVPHKRIYEWNKKFGYIFKNDLLTDDNKIKILKEVLCLIENTNISAKQAILQVSNKYNVSYKELYSWNRKFNIFETKQKFSDKDIIFILNEIKKQSNPENLGEMILQFAKKLKISEHTIYSWNRKFNIIDVRAYENRQTSVYDENFKKNVLQEFMIIGFNSENIKMLAIKYNITERNIYDWNRIYQMFDTKMFKKGGYKKFKNEIVAKLETDKDFKNDLLNSIKQKSKE